MFGKKKGFNVTVANDEKTFCNELKTDKYDVAWIISDSQRNDFDTKEFKETVIDYHRKGKGLFIYGDNSPYFHHCNIILPDLVGCKLEGDTPGDKTITYGDVKVSGHFDSEHILFAGINNLYEGITICYPNQECKLTTLAMSTDGHPCICCCERGMSNISGGGRIVVDTGFTKLYRRFWATAGQARYVVNATVWLVDLEGRHGMSVDDF